MEIISKFAADVVRADYIRDGELALDSYVLDYEKVPANA